MLEKNREPEEPSGSHELDDNPQLSLAALASIKNHRALSEIKTITEPLINIQTDNFCRRFCAGNSTRYRCSLTRETVATGTEKSDRKICSWGTASLDWMFASLTAKQCLLGFRNRSGDQLSDYFFQIINSQNFFQRWKKWRLQQEDDIPKTIINMGPDSIRIFRLLQEKRKPDFIAEQIGLEINQVEDITTEIIENLIQNNTIQTLEGGSCEHKPGSPVESDCNNEKGDLELLWENLSVVEKFVIEAILINKQAEEDILMALQTLDIRIQEGVLPEETNACHLHAFRDSILKKLSSITIT